jgi:hypothetical protein
MWFTDGKGNKVNTDSSKTGINSSQMHEKGSDLVDDCVMDSCNKCGYYHKVGGECIDPKDFSPKIHDKASVRISMDGEPVDNDIKIKTKEIGTDYKIELGYLDDGGGMIGIWCNDLEGLEMAKRLPHIFRLSSDGKWYYMGEAHFGFSVNAIDRYDNLKTGTDVLKLMHDANYF